MNGPERSGQEVSVPRTGFALGVEYMTPGLAKVYADAGVKWAKAAGAGFARGTSSRSRL